MRPEAVYLHGLAKIEADKRIAEIRERIKRLEDINHDARIAELDQFLRFDLPFLLNLAEEIESAKDYDFSKDF